METGATGLWTAAAAVQARRVAAERAAHRLALEVERLRAEGMRVMLLWHVR